MENNKLKTTSIVAIIAAVAFLVLSLFSFSTQSDLSNKLEGSNLEIAELTQSNTELVNSIDELQSQLDAIKAAEEIVNETDAEESETKYIYVIDEKGIGTSVEDTLSDKELNLYDTKVEFNDSDYDVEEYLILNGPTVSANNKDFESNVYSTLEKGDIEYKVKVKDSLKQSNTISKDESLKIDFLGETLDIIGWTDTKIKVEKSQKVALSVGESITVDGVTLTIDDVYSGSVMVNGEIIDDKYTKKVDGIKVEVQAIGYHDYSPETSKVILKVGEKLTETYENGDDYDDDSVWEWVITENSIGIKLAKDFDELDDDDGYNALDVGDSISLPNDYVVITFDGLEDVDYEDYTFKRDKAGNLKIVGKFDDYDKVYFNVSDKKFYEDDDFEEVIGDSIELDNSDFELRYNSTTGNLTIGSEVSITANLSNIYVNGVDRSEIDEDYRSNYGFIIESPEDAIEDETISLSIPSDKVEASFSFY